LTGAVSITVVAGVVLLSLRGLWAAWDVSDRWRFLDGADYVLSPEFWGFAMASIIALEALAIVALGWPLVPSVLAMLGAVPGAVFEFFAATTRKSRSSRDVVLSEANTGILIAVARFVAAALFLWPIFAGMSHFGVDALLVERWQLYPLSEDPPRLWMGVLVGLPVWFCFWLWGDMAMRYVRDWSVSGPAVPTPAEEPAVAATQATEAAAEAAPPMV
jgi:hypothetical protein